jgi:hypothetical protein
VLHSGLGMTLVVIIIVTAISIGIAGIDQAKLQVQANPEAALSNQGVARLQERVASVEPAQKAQSAPPQSRGYLTTPDELKSIKHKADQGVEPYEGAVKAVLEWAESPWEYELRQHSTCKDSESPRWLDNGRGVPRLYARSLAYHLTGNNRYAAEVKEILERIMTRTESISLKATQCRLNFAWAIPEVIAAADLIEDYWYDKHCTGPISTLYDDTAISTGNCKHLFQNWLVKNPYYVVSYSTTAQSNWGAAATNTTAYIADYLWDRPEVQLHHRIPEQVNYGQELLLSPTEAYALSNKLMFDRMNGYGVEYGSSSSCDYLSGDQQKTEREPAKSQITENGIITEDARREQHCNIETYNGAYQNYPQLHIGHNVQQCELMQRRGDNSCYDNIDNSDIPNYRFFDPEGMHKATHLHPGRGSLERAIKAVIVDSRTQWKHDSALAVAYRYYYSNHTLSGIESWRAQLDVPLSCDQDICFGLLTHGFAPDEVPGSVPIVSAP